ncbi:hypothetical protein, partial [Burkholderia sp. Bp8998]|uniref:hypothetical protein n=1 Tax=Burkholderia sp. Bp8998 TaxID=2184557 RepID=UPI001C89883C
SESDLCRRADNALFNRLTHKNADRFIGAFAGFTPLIILRSQRSFRKYSETVRKRLLAAVVFLGSTGTTVLGLLYFGIVFLSGVLQTYATEVAPLRHRPDPIVANVMLGMLLIAAPIAAVKVWRDLKLGELIFDLPKRLLKRLVLQRKYVTVLTSLRLRHCDGSW